MLTMHLQSVSLFVNGTVKEKNLMIVIQSELICSGSEYTVFLIRNHLQIH